MGVLRPLLPAKYAPLQANGNGMQGSYLTELSPPLAETLAGLIGAEVQILIGSVPVGAPMQTNDDLDYWEHKIEAEIVRDTVKALTAPPPSRWSSRPGRG